MYLGRIGLWYCKHCKASSKATQGNPVFQGPMYQGTKILQKWFLAICLILNAKKGSASYQLQRDLDLNQKTAWYILTRIRAEIAEKVNAILFAVL